MIKSMFAGVSGLRAHQSKMDIISNNIANVNTPSFKAGRATFKDSFYQTMKPASGAGGGFGGGNPNQLGYGSQIGSVDVLFTRGGFAPTDSPTDVMIDGNGFYMVGPAVEAGKTPAPEELNLTRVGIFNFDEEGYLVDSNRNYVYGYQATFVPYKAAGADPKANPEVLAHYEVQPIAPATTLELSRLKVQNAITNPKGTTIDDATKKTPDATGTGFIDTPAKKMELTGQSIGADGKIGGSFNGTNITVGQIAVANVPNPNALQMTGNSYYKAVENTGIVTANVPGAGSTGTLVSGGLELANVDLAKEFSDMITTQRGFQANTRMITVSDEMLQELVNLKR